MADMTIGDSEGRGRGVFAARLFEAHETIEVCPVITLSETDARPSMVPGLMITTSAEERGKGGSHRPWLWLLVQSLAITALHQKHVYEGTKRRATH